MRVETTLLCIQMNFYANGLPEWRRNNVMKERNFIKFRYQETCLCHASQISLKVN